jgi:anti-sigma B factor antagonist
VLATGVAQAEVEQMISSLRAVSATVFAFNWGLVNDMPGKPGEEQSNPSPPHEAGRPRGRAPVQDNANGDPACARARDGNDATAGRADGRSFRIELRQGCAVVVASGEIDLTTAPALRHALDAASQVATRVVLDFGLVTFIDSSGLAVLLDAYRHRRFRQQISLCLGSTANIVRRVLEITRINTMLPTYATLEEAIAAST